jgi:hypothetical protein
MLMAPSFQTQGRGEMTDTKITPETGVLAVTGNAVALILDGPGGTVINDFRGTSRSEVVDGFVKIEVLEAPPRGRENEPNVLGVLASVLTHRNQAKPRIEQGRDANGEDGVLVFPNGDRLAVQIVSVPVDSNHWKNVSKGKAAVQLSIEEAASWLHEAIEKKKRAIASADGARIVLALDTRHCAQLAHEQVIESFHRQFGDAAIYGFAQIWLVGPVTGRCWKL